MTKKYSRTFDRKEFIHCRGANLKCHFKNTRETAAMLKGKSLPAAVKYLEDVIKHKDVVPFRVHTGGIGHTAQAKKYKFANGRWPEKSCRFLLDLLRNARLNAENRRDTIDPAELFVQHIQVQQARQTRRRTYRAHGRIQSILRRPCHVEMILGKKAGAGVAKPAEGAVAAAPEMLTSGASASS